MKKYLLYAVFMMAVVEGIVFSAFGKQAPENKAGSVVFLTVEGRTEPVGIDELHPRFGWRLIADQNGVKQTAYHLLVSSSREKSEQCDGDIWDSGVVESDVSQWVGVDSLALQPNQTYFWRVRIMTNKGQTDWSPIAMWATGLLEEAHWQGEWIGIDSLLLYDSDSRHSRCTGRYFRKEFRARGNVRRAMVHVSGLGTYLLYINGRRVGQDWLTPVPTDYTRTVAYNTYDVTSLLAERNVVGAVVEAGYFFAPAQNYQANVRTTYGTPRLRLDLVIEYADGTTETIKTDRSWKLNADGAVRYSNLYDGEMYDSRLEWENWLRPGYDDHKWRQAEAVSAPGGIMRGNITEPVRVYAVDKPLGIRRYGDRYILDFGTNASGVLRLRLRVAHGDTVCIRHAELLASDTTRLYTANLRSAEQKAFYIGNGKESVWQPEFTWFGFRYAEITGVRDLQARDVERLLLSDDLIADGNSIVIEGNETLNHVVQAALQGIRSNYKGMPIDCPQRDERMPWLGDRTTGCLGESYLLGVYPLYRKWLRDICDSQQTNGALSDVAPAYWRLYNTNITWPAALPFGCEMLYRQYGDSRPIEECYPAVDRWLRYVRSKSYKDGLITYDRYGDWCVPPESLSLIHSKDSSRVTDGRLISSCYYFYLCRWMARHAVRMQKETDVLYYEQEAEITRRAINDMFLKDGTYGNSTVTANLMPLAMGIVPIEAEEAVRRTLIETIVKKNDCRLSCGVIGIQWLMRYLSEIGHGDIAYRIASNEEYPGWGYMVKNGATTIWELWNGNTADPSMNSGNHVMLLGDLLPWCFENLAGIKSDPKSPGFKHVVMRPDFHTKALSGILASHNSPYGLIRSEWYRRDSGIEWKIVLPPNTTAEVRLPNGKVKHLLSGTHVFKHLKLK